MRIFTDVRQQLLELLTADRWLRTVLEVRGHHRRLVRCARHIEIDDQRRALAAAHFARQVLANEHGGLPHTLFERPVRSLNHSNPDGEWNQLRRTGSDSVRARRFHQGSKAVLVDRELVKQLLARLRIFSSVEGMFPAVRIDLDELRHAQFICTIRRVADHFR